MDLLFPLKFIISFMGGFFIYVGSIIEPSVGVWVISIGGALLTASLGEDKTFVKVITHIFIGLGWGIFGSQIIHGIWINIPQVASAFFSAMFGVEATWYVFRNLRTGSVSEFIASIIGSIIPDFIKQFGKKK